MFHSLIYIAIFFFLILYSPQNLEFEPLKLIIALLLLPFCFIFQNRFLKKKQNFLNHLSQIEILLYFYLACFFFGLRQAFNYPSLTFLLCVIQYLSLTAFETFDRLKSHSSKASFSTILKKIFIELALVIPLFFISLLLMFGVDVAAYFNFQFSMISSTILSLLLLILFLYLFPLMLVTFWHCTPLKNPLHENLLIFCKSANFNCRDIRSWTLFENRLTGGIVGLFPSTRFILLTPGLTRHLSDRAIEAVVAHEIGHSQNHHLLILPLIFSGVFLPFLFFNPENFLEFALSAFYIFTYIRYIFGFYLRRLERQADLHGIALGLSPDSMIEALQTVGMFSKQSLNQPDWHHYSLQERVDFLKSIQRDSFKADHFQRKLKYWLRLYFICFSLTLIYFMVYFMLGLKTYD